MIILDWIMYELLPIFGITSERLSEPLAFPWLSEGLTVGDAVNTLFVVGLATIAFHLLFVVPYRCILKLCKYKGVRLK